MPIPIKPFPWVDSEGPDGLILAANLNADFDVLYAILNAGLGPDNVLPQVSGLDSIPTTDEEMEITAAWTFLVDPILAVDTLIAQLDIAQEFTEPQSFAAGVDFENSGAKGVVLTPETLPTGSSGLIGRVAFQGSDSHFYGWNGTAWVLLDYTGAYTGGAAKAYSMKLELDDADFDSAMFKTAGATPTVKLALTGMIFPRRHYLCLPQHTHAFTPTPHVHDITDPWHQHTVTIPSHGHDGTFALSTHYHIMEAILTGAEGNRHTHLLPNLLLGGYETSWSTAITSPDSDPQHTHTVPQASTGLPSVVAGVSPTTIGAIVSSLVLTGITINEASAAGTNANAGVSVALPIDTVAKSYASGLRIYIDSTEITAHVLSATGWSAIGDGTGTHAFNVAGTGELDISAWMTYSPGIHILKIVEPISGCGCRVRAHVETS